MQRSYYFIPYSQGNLTDEELNLYNSEMFLSHSACAGREDLAFLFSAIQAPPFLKQ